jgi:DUF1680 family protein
LSSDTSLAASSSIPVVPATGLLSPLAISRVEMATSGFWGSRKKINAANTMDHARTWMERVGWIGNFDAASEGTLPEARRGREFADSEIYKLIEAMSWEYGTSPDEALDETIRALTARVKLAQEPDGYLNTNFGRPGQQERYSDLEWGHELYNYGHLLQAAVARVRTSGRDELFEVARKVADHVCDTFGAGGIERVCGHPEIELGLIEFGRLTGDERYLEQARLFLDRRGHGTLGDIEWGRSYYQDDMPIREATVLRGHAVRALYLAAAAVDLVAETGDTELLNAVETQWRNTIAARTYITGGMGSHHQDEAFGEDFVLPSDRAYCETCAGVASVMLSWRLLLATGKPEYADLIERTLFNIVATSPAPDGRSFFYANTLHRRSEGSGTVPDSVSPRASSSMRAPWFDVSCCPTNVARTLASIGGYLATVNAAGVQLHQYSSAVVAAALTGGEQVVVRMETDYPNDPDIRITVIESPATPWTLSVRVPAWAEGATLDAGAGPAEVSPGYSEVTRVFQVGDSLTLTLPIEPRLTFPDRRIDAIRGSIAAEAGPLVLCVESVDLPKGAHVDRLIVDTTAPLRVENNTVVLTGSIALEHRSSWPYSVMPREELGSKVQVPLVPYFMWANRGPSTMRVWLRTE